MKYLKHLALIVAVTFSCCDLSRANDCGCPQGDKVKIWTTTEGVVNTLPITLEMLNVYGSPAFDWVTHTGVKGERIEVHLDANKIYTLQMGQTVTIPPGSENRLKIHFPHCAIEYLDPDYGWLRANYYEITGKTANGNVTISQLKLRIVEDVESENDSEEPGSESDLNASPPRTTPDYDPNHTPSTHNSSPSSAGMSIPLGGVSVAGEAFPAGKINLAGVLTTSLKDRSNFAYFMPEEVDSANGGPVTAVSDSGGLVSVSTPTHSAQIATVSGKTKITVKEGTNVIATYEVGSKNGQAGSHFAGWDGIELTQTNRGVVKTPMVALSDVYTGGEDTYSGSLDGSGNPFDGTLYESSTTDSSGERIMTEIQYRDGVVVSSTIITTKRFWWGEEKISEIKDPTPAANGSHIGTDTETVTWDYYISGSNGNGQIKSVTSTEGEWAYYQYDSKGRIEGIQRPWLNSGLASGPVNLGTLNIPTYTEFTQYEYSGDTETVTTMAKDSGSSVRTIGKTVTEREPGKTIVQEYAEDGTFATTETEYHIDTSSAPAKFINSPKLRIGPLGQTTRYHYHMGNWNSNSSLASQFTANASGTSWRIMEDEVVSALSGGNWTQSEVDGCSTRRISIYSKENGLELTELQIWNGSDWEKATTTDYKYYPLAQDDRRRLEDVKQDTRVIASYSYPTELSKSAVDEEGIETVSYYDTDGRLEKTVKIAGGNPAPDAGDQIVEYFQNGLSTSTAVNGRVESSQTFDAMGRTTTSTDRYGRTATYSYSNGGVGGFSTTTTIIILDNDGQSVTRTTTTKSYASGKIAERTDTHGLNQYFTYSLIDGTGIDDREETTVHYGTPAGARFQETTTRWNGSTEKVVFPSADGPGNLTRTYVYTSNGFLSKILHSAPNTPDQVFCDPSSGGSQLEGKIILGMYSEGGADGGSAGYNGLSSSDRLIVSEELYEEDPGTLTGWYHVSKRKVFNTNSNTGSFSETITRTKLNQIGGQSVVTTLPTGGTSTRTVTYERTNKKTLSIQTYPYLETISVNGYVTKTRKAYYGADDYDVFSYDGEGQLVKITDARGGATRFGYDAMGHRTSETQHGGQVTRSFYHLGAHVAAGQVYKTINPEGEVTEVTFTDRGQVGEISGGGTYQRSYSYDDYGQMTLLTTHRETNQSSTTGWMYQEATGVLLHKVYDMTDSNSNGLVDSGELTGSGVTKTTYTYTSDGRLKTKQLARGGGSAPKATYTYNGMGDLTGISYTNDQNLTPDVTFSSHDRRGRPGKVTETFPGGNGDTDLSYHPETGRISGLNYASNHPYLNVNSSGAEVTYSAPDSLGRPTGYQGSTLEETVYSYSSERLTNVKTYTEGAANTSKPHTFHDYVYHPNSRHIKEISSRYKTPDENNTEGQHWSHRHTDLLGRLTGIRTETRKKHASGGGLNTIQKVVSAGYKFDRAGRRTRTTREDGTFWQYRYNDRGEVISGIRYLDENTKLAGQQFWYSYDGIGNRETATLGGDINGNNLRTISYSPNSKNQYTSISRPRYYHVLAKDEDSPKADVEVEVNDNGIKLDLSNQGNWFYKEIGLSASTSWEKIENEITSDSTGSIDITGHLWIPPGSRSPTYDDDGNLTSDGRWNYTWDARNRLVKMKSQVPLVGTTGHQQIDFVYDWLGRRISKKITTNTSPSATTTIHLVFLYDGWNLIAEFDRDSGSSWSDTAVRAYTWGLDLSGSFQGAGGVGGLLKVRNSGGTDYTYPAFDGNGNIIAWSDLSGTGGAGSEEVQKVDYDPFGNVIAREGSVPGGDQPMGFSTKYEDEETGLLYYGYRYYDPVTGRWPSRDPIEEEGSLNIYGMLDNDSINFVDILGLRRTRRDIQRQRKCCGGKPLPRGKKCCGGKPYTPNGRRGGVGARCCKDGKLGKTVPRWKEEGYSSVRECMRDVLSNPEIVVGGAAASGAGGAAASKPPPKLPGWGDRRWRFPKTRGAGGAALPLVPIIWATAGYCNTNVCSTKK